MTDSYLLAQRARMRSVLQVIVSSCGFNAFPDYFRGDIAGWSHSGYMPRLRTRYELDLHKVPFDFPDSTGLQVGGF